MVTVVKLLDGRFGLKQIGFGFHLEHYDEPDRSQGEAAARGISESRVHQGNAFMWSITPRLSNAQVNKMSISQLLVSFDDPVTTLVSRCCIRSHRL